jgi:hypothetical protein
MEQNKTKIDEILEKFGKVIKFRGVAPEGFVLVHEKTLEDLKNWYVWEQWKEGKISLDELNKTNFQNT